MTILAAAIKLELSRPQVIAQYGPEMGTMLITAQVEKCRQEWAAELAKPAALAGSGLKMGRKR